jgi:hypothetical protein
MKNTTILILTLFLSNPLIGQDAIIRGKVLLESGEKAFSQVTIMVKGQINGGIVDSLGYYEILNLSIGSSYNIFLLGFGYEQVEKRVTLKDTITNIDFTVIPNCDGYDEERALSDIKKGKPKLLLFGSIVPTANRNSDNRFEKKYRLKYYDFGCTPPAMECMKEYNTTVFKYLDDKYGKTWRKSVRQDVEFLE